MLRKLCAQAFRPGATMNGNVITHIPHHGSPIYAIFPRKELLHNTIVNGKVARRPAGTWHMAIPLEEALVVQQTGLLQKFLCNCNVVRGPIANIVPNSFAPLTTTTEEQYSILVVKTTQFIQPSTTSA